jgi:hypothetical protein
LILILFLVVFLGSPWYKKLKQFDVVEATNVVNNDMSKEIHIDFEGNEYKISLASHPDFISSNYKEFTLEEDGSWTQDSILLKHLQSCFYNVRCFVYLLCA